MMPQKTAALDLLTVKHVFGTCKTRFENAVNARCDWVYTHYTIFSLFSYTGKYILYKEA